MSRDCKDHTNFVMGPVEVLIPRLRSADEFFSLMACSRTGLCQGGVEMSVDRSNQSKDDRRILLLIDDEPDMVEVMFTILDSRDTHVLLALNGQEALEMMKQQPVDAVLTDIRMPEMSGVELVQKMRALGFATPVVMMSGFADLDTTLEALRSGVLDVIEKPFSREKMIATLKHALHLGSSVRRIHGELGRIFDKRELATEHSDVLRHLSMYLAGQELTRMREESQQEEAIETKRAA